HNEMNDRLPGQSQPRSKVVQIRCKRGPIAAVDVDFRSGVRDAVEGVADSGVEIFLAVETLVPSAENVPTQARGDRQSLGCVVRILEKGSVVRVGVGLE